jgi:hypothetical protein
MKENRTTRQSNKLAEEFVNLVKNKKNIKANQKLGQILKAKCEKRIKSVLEKINNE